MYVKIYIVTQIWYDPEEGEHRRVVAAFKDKDIADAFEEKHEVLESEVADSSKPSYIAEPQARQKK